MVEHWEFPMMSTQLTRPQFSLQEGSTSQLQQAPKIRGTPTANHFPPHRWGVCLEVLRKHCSCSAGQLEAPSVIVACESGFVAFVHP